jgi:hypothetical protein
MLAVLMVVASAHARGAEISVRPSRARLESGARQKAIVSGLPAGGTATVYWIDPDGRIRGQWPVQGKARRESAADFRTRGARAGIHRLEVSLDEGAPASAEFEIIPAPPVGYLAILAARTGEADDGDFELARTLGFPCVASQDARRPDPALGWMAQVISAGPQFLRLDEDRLTSLTKAYALSQSQELLSRPSCLNDTSWLEQVWRWYGPRADGAAHDRPWLWSLGRDLFLAPEGGSLDFCRSLYCRRTFSSVLKRKHVIIDPLNGRWGTAFRKWSDTRPATAAEMIAALSRTDAVDRADAFRKLASWFDHKDFMDRTWADAVSVARSVTLSTHRTAEVGLEAPMLPSVYAGGNATRLLPALDWVSVPARMPELALARSMSGPRSKTLTELGDEDPVRAMMRGLVYGHRGCVYRPAGPAPGDERTRADLAKMRDAISGGLDEFFKQATWESDKVAVVYSHPSIRVEWALDAASGNPETRAGQALAAWLQVLADLGMAPQVLDEGQVARGALRRDGYKALILPRTYCMSSKCLSQVVKFARSGGLVIADAGTALLDGDANPVSSAAIEGLFGIAPGRSLMAHVTRTREGAAPSLRGITRPGAYIDGVDAQSIRLVDPNVRALGSHSLAFREGVEGLVTNPFGRGRGVYLNAGLERYNRERATPYGVSIRNLVRNCLELAQVDSRIQIVADGERLDGCEVALWRLEETLVLVMFVDGALGHGRRRAELILDDINYCYDVLEGVLLGKGGRIKIDLDVGVHVFALLPYDVESITLSPYERNGIVHFRAFVETSTGLSWTHILEQELLNANGETVPGTQVIHTADRGVSTGSAAFAPNEPAGEYQLVLRDVLTGVEGALTLVKKPTDLEALFPVTQAAALPDRTAPP